MSNNYQSRNVLFRREELDTVLSMLGGRDFSPFGRSVLVKMAEAILAYAYAGRLEDVEFRKSVAIAAALDGRYEFVIANDAAGALTAAVRINAEAVAA